jgi:hypothetical protein
MGIANQANSERRATSERTLDKSSLANYKSSRGIYIRNTFCRTVNQLWSITEDLNVLYKDNWTRLAAQEVKQFQVSREKSPQRGFGLSQAMAQHVKYGRGIR